MKSIQKTHNVAYPFFYLIVFLSLFVRAIKDYFVHYETFSQDALLYFSDISMVMFLSIFVFLVLCIFYRGNITIPTSLYSVLLISIGGIFNTNIFLFVFIFIFWSVIKTFIDTKKYILFMFIIFAVMIFLILIIYFWGNSFFQYDTRFGMVETYGLDHKNRFPIYIFIFSLYFVVLFDKHKLLIISYILCLLFISYYLFTTRSLFIGIILILFFYIIKNKKIIKFAYIIPFSLFLISLYIALMLDSNPNLIILDYASSGRFYLANKALNDLQGMNELLFGCASYIDNEIPLDNSYLAMLINYGIIPTIFYLYSLTIAIKNLYKENQTTILSMVIVLCFFALFENQFTRIIYNFVIYFMVHKLYHEKN